MMSKWKKIKLVDLEFVSKLCEMCGKRFKTKYVNQRYCCGPCGSRAWRIRKRYERYLKTNERENEVPA